MNTSYVTQAYSALLDSPTNAVLTISSSVPAVVFLNECIPDTFPAFSINHPNYARSFLGRFFLRSIKPEDYPKWTWDDKTREFVNTKRELLNDELFNKSRLAEGKRKILEKIVTYLNMARYKVNTGVLSQSFVYLEKEMQARDFRDSGYNKDLIMEYPYVMQYADFAHISLRQAAEDILLKAKFDEDILYKTELLRLKYFNRVKTMTELAELPNIDDDFQRENYRNAKI